MASDPQSWETVVDTLIHEIEQNKYKKGEKLPTEVEMAARFGVTRLDIRKAYERLKELDYVYSMRGRGSFFSEAKEMIPLRLRGGSFSKKMRELGIPYESKTIESTTIRYDPLIFEPLKAQKKDKIWKIVRLRIINHQLAAMHTSYLPEKYFPNLPQDAPNITSVFNYFEQTGHVGHRGAGVQLRVGTLTKKERDLLGVRGYAPGLILTGTRLAADGETVLELLRTVYRSDRFVFLL